MTIYIIISFTLLTLSSIIFPGVGWFTFIITLFIVVRIHCNENFKLNQYYPDRIIFDEAELERDLDGTRAAYSSAVGDTEDIYWIPKIAKYKNLILNKNDIKEYGNIFDMINTPRPLYTTSLLSKEIGSY